MKCSWFLLMGMLLLLFGANDPESGQFEPAGAGRTVYPGKQAALLHAQGQRAELFFPEDLT